MRASAGATVPGSGEENPYIPALVPAQGSIPDTSRLAVPTLWTSKVLVTYVPAFSKFLAGATGLPESALASLTTEHVTTTKAVVDLQGAGKPKEAADADRMAAQHMQMVGDPLAAAIVAKMPEKF